MILDIIESTVTDSLSCRHPFFDSSQPVLGVGHTHGDDRQHEDKHYEDKPYQPLQKQTVTAHRFIWLISSAPTVSGNHGGTADDKQPRLDASHYEIYQRHNGEGRQGPHPVPRP